MMIRRYSLLLLRSFVLTTLALLLVSCAGRPWVPTITTVAGGDVGDGGPASMARLIDPSGVALDRKENLFIADTGNHRIRKVDLTTGVITTVAGTGVRGFSGDGGPATDSKLSTPTHVALDGKGNLFIADVANYRTRKVDLATGIISTVAGNGRAGFAGDGGPATSAEFAWPARIAVDRGGNLFVADMDNHRIRRVDVETGIVSTVAGSGLTGRGAGGFDGDGGPATRAQLNRPAGVAVSANGDLFIADMGNGRIRKVTAGTGVITTVAGSGSTAPKGERRGWFAFGDGGPATAAGFGQPDSLAFDADGNLLIADPPTAQVRKLDLATGLIAPVAGTRVLRFREDDDDDTADDEDRQEKREALIRQVELSNPSDIAADGKGKLFVAQPGPGLIQVVDLATGLVSDVAGRGEFEFLYQKGRLFRLDGVEERKPATRAQLEKPTGLALDGRGNLFIVDQGDHRVLRVALATGIIDTAAGEGPCMEGGKGACQGDRGRSGPARKAQLYEPSGVVADGKGNLYIADSGNGFIRKVDLAVGIITRVGQEVGQALSEGEVPAIGGDALAIDGHGNLFVAYGFGHRIKKVDFRNGTLTEVAGSGPTGWEAGGFSGDGGPATSAQLNHPSGIAVDGHGNLFIADTKNHRVRKVDLATGIITTAAGSGGTGLQADGFSGDGGLATNTQLRSPSGLAFDGRGNLYIADSGNDRIRKVDRATGMITTVAGPETGVDLAHPSGIALDEHGNLFIADEGNRRIGLSP